MSEVDELIQSRGCIGTVNWDEKRGFWYGHITNIGVLMNYVGKTKDEMKKHFEETVDMYFRMR